MRVTQVAIRPTEVSNAQERPSLTPELLAAVGARYSRSNEGLDAILSRVDGSNLDASVDSIFRMIDYGHQSIADMAPVAVFVDGVSLMLAYLVWSWCPTAGGQESSTRYLRLSRDEIVDPALLGVAREDLDTWHAFIDKAFISYGESLSLWEGLATRNPSLTKIPLALLNDRSDKAQKQVARMRRNYAFDRARYFLPLAAKTNLMLTMSARGWVQLSQTLLSHWLPEAVALGHALRSELELATPRMVRHATLKESFQSGLSDELRQWSDIARCDSVPQGEAECASAIDLLMPAGLSEDDLVAGLSHHDNRYAFMGASVSRTSVRFGWSAVAIAEVRDLNRHRTGTKYCPLVPRGFYCATDQLPPGALLPSALPAFGDKSNQTARSLLVRRNAGFGAWLLLGAQFRFEHTTTLDKYVYEAELRTGSGAHYRYAAHFRQSVRTLHQHFPKLASSIRLGLGEPE